MKELFSKKTDQVALRIGLDQMAASSYHAMIERVLAKNEYVKASPSRYISFVITRYFETYFENDIDLISQHFFDSKEYLTVELRKAKSQEEVRGTLEKFMQSTRPSVERKKRIRYPKPANDF